eukprot:TRINITY_DN781817_c0_g1_i1.p1 TRINITY_DN781817_c0_g1~~TRINITY_DN781817_c0_g1_i1.p1  ORF type:complete len:410 (+),score=87.84 TRINITY_DN781817_c0_g1_i1:44-1231(+)
MSTWKDVPQLPPNAIFDLTRRFREDTFDKKLNLGIGAYRTEELKPYVFEAVKKAQNEIAADETLVKEYLPITGDVAFATAAQELLFGEGDEKICSVQSLSGTGCLRVGMAFVKKNLNVPVYLPNPTWANHKGILKECGLEMKEYRYYKTETRGLDFEGLMEDLAGAEAGSVVLLHVCAHNPTGVDPSEEQWRKIAVLFKEKNLIPFFDCAYQGFASGDLEKDAFSVRHFAAEGLYPIAAQSFSKNMGLYGERAGALHFVTSSPEEAKAIKSQLSSLIRPMYSNPPRHGAEIARRILTTPALREMWIAELGDVTARILKMRSLLREALIKNGAPGNWDHVVNQIGMFTYTGLTAEQSTRMVDTHHVYMLKSGRISIAGVSAASVDYLADCIKEVLQ